MRTSFFEKISDLLTKKANQKEYKRLDKKWRKIIFSTPITNNVNEWLLVKFLLQYQDQITPLEEYPYVFAYEFPINPERSQEGKIDLVLARPQKEKTKFLVVEVKYLQTKTGKTSRTGRKQKRRKVEEQSRENRVKFQRLYSNAQVASVYFTNEHFTDWGSDLREEYQVFIQEEWEKVYQQYPVLKEDKDVEE